MYYHSVEHILALTEKHSAVPCIVITVGDVRFKALLGNVRVHFGPCKRHLKVSVDCTSRDTYRSGNHKNSVHATQARSSPKISPSSSRITRRWSFIPIEPRPPLHFLFVPPHPPSPRSRHSQIGAHQQVSAPKASQYKHIPASKVTLGTSNQSGRGFPIVEA